MPDRGCRSVAANPPDQDSLIRLHGEQRVSLQLQRVETDRDKARNSWESVRPHGVVWPGGPVFQGQGVSP